MMTKLASRIKQILKQNRTDVEVEQDFRRLGAARRKMYLTETLSTDDMHRETQETNLKSHENTLHGGWEKRIASEQP